MGWNRRRTLSYLTGCIRPEAAYLFGSRFSNLFAFIALLSRRVIVLVVAVACVGCAAHPQVNQRLHAEFTRQDFLPNRTGGLSGQITMAEMGQRWVERDSETVRQVTKVFSAGLDVAEARSWIWPRVDVEFRSSTAKVRNTHSFRTDMSGGLVLHYDFKKLMFYSDAAAVAAAGRDVSLQRALLAIDSSLSRLENQIIEWHQLREAVSIEEERSAQFSRLMEMVHSLDQLGTLPLGSFAEWKHREQVARWQHDEAVRRLEYVQRSLQTQLGLAEGAELNFGHLDFLLHVPPLSEKTPGEGEPREWLSEVWQSHPACRISELELFQAEMGVIAAKRERWPRLTGSIGLGEMNTRVGNDIVEANGTAEIGVSMPIFDAGSISRDVKKAELNRDLARGNLRILAWSLVRDAQNTLATLHAAQSEVEHRRMEYEETGRLAEDAEHRALSGLGDPLLPFTLRIYQTEAKLGLSEAKMKLAKAWLAYRVAVGEETVSGLSTTLLEGLMRDWGNAGRRGKE
jgi:outer membrane protein TolC